MTIDVWVTAAVLDTNVWTVLHPTHESALRFFQNNGADDGCYRHLETSPYSTVEWAGRENSIRFVTEYKQLKISASGTD